jgi:acetyl-CoA carboxylase carboxyl transferase subunit alpha
MYGEELDFEKPIIELEKRIEELKSFSASKDIDLSEEIKKLEKKAKDKKTEIFKNITAWQRTQLARHPKRPYTLDYIGFIMEEFIELHGDRTFYDDRAIIGGIASFDGRTVIVLGHQKGRDTKENLKRNFGMAHPEGYRKALRLMKLGEKFSFPIITFIDTPGAYPGIGAEERGQACAIAINLKEMSSLAVPIVAIVIGEGGSGGALGISVGNHIYMLENAVYYVCSPEACSSILWRDVSKAPTAAEAQCITAQDLLKFGIIDGIIPEPIGGSHREPEETAKNIKSTLKKALEELSSFSTEKLIRQRQAKYRKIGEFSSI